MTLTQLLEDGLDRTRIDRDAVDEWKSKLWWAISAYADAMFLYGAAKGEYAVEHHGRLADKKYQELREILR